MYGLYNYILDLLKLCKEMSLLYSISAYQDIHMQVQLNLHYQLRLSINKAVESRDKVINERNRANKRKIGKTFSRRCKLNDSQFEAVQKCLV